jgi:peptide/nickel transport system ATP-binding protein
VADNRRIPSSAGALLAVEDLWVRFPGRTGPVEAVRGVGFTMGREKLGIVGESGSGKSMTARAVLRLVPPPGRVSAARLEFDGVDLQVIDEPAMRQVRGRRISMLLQDAKFSLNPVMTVGQQIDEAYRAHADGSPAETRRRTLEMLAAVRIRDPERVYRAFPHELSGGMGQRAMIAMMLSPDPDLLIADEPTSALDASRRDGFVELLLRECRAASSALVFVSHDLALAARFDRTIALHAINRAAGEGDDS